MLVSPAPANAIFSSARDKRKKENENNKALMPRTRILILACDGAETITTLPQSYSDLKALARNWEKSAASAPFSLRVPVQHASSQVSRFIRGEYIYLSGEESYQIAITGVKGLRVEVVAENPPPMKPPPPPPPPVLKIQTTFTLELAPGKSVKMDVKCETDEFDMSRTEDGALVAGTFMGKLDIIHDHDAKVHKMGFTGTRLKGKEHPRDLFFDVRKMGKPAIAAKPSVAKCNISISSPKQQYCDVILSFSSMWKLGNIWPPAELDNDKVKFFLRVHPGKELELFESNTVVTSLYYEAIPKAGAFKPVDVLSPRSSFAMSVREFIPHINGVLETLGLSTYARTSFVCNLISCFHTYKNVAYSFMPPKRLASTIDLAVTHSPRILTRIFLMYRGISDDELVEFTSARRGIKEASVYDWKKTIGLSNSFRDKHAFRVLETSILEIN